MSDTSSSSKEDENGKAGCRNDEAGLPNFSEIYYTLSLLVNPSMFQIHIVLQSIGKLPGRRQYSKRCVQHVRKQNLPVLQTILRSTRMRLKVCTSVSFRIYCLERNNVLCFIEASPSSRKCIPGKKIYHPF
jgi:hypothetical protein